MFDGQGPIVALYLAGDPTMTTLMRATRLFAAVAAIGAAGTVAASAQAPTSTPTISSFSLTRPEFTRPAGLAGNARSLAAREQYLLAPAQPTDPAGPKKRKKL